VNLGAKTAITAETQRTQNYAELKLKHYRVMRKLPMPETY